MRPTLRTVLVMTLGVPIALAAALVHPQVWPLWLAYLSSVSVLIACDLLFAAGRRRIQVTASAPEVLFIGDTDATLALRFAASRARPLIEVLLETDEQVEPPPAATARLTADGATTLHLPLIPRRRGKSAIRAVWLRWCGPFGLTVRGRRVALDLEVPITPNVRAVRAAAMRYFARDSLLGIKVDQSRGDGSEFESLRDWVPGFDLRAIDWKHSARHRKLVCKEFRAERNHPIVIAIDTGHLMSEPVGGIPRLDAAINAGLLLAYVSLRVGDRVGLFGFDSRVRLFSEPAAGVQSFPRLQRLTAELDYRTDETNFTLGLAELATRLTRRSLVVVLTDFTDTVTAELMVENVARLARKHLVLFVSLRNPGLGSVVEVQPRGFRDMAEAVVAADFIRERELVLERLRRFGVLSVDAPPGAVSSQLIDQYLHIKRRELV